VLVFFCSDMSVIFFWDVLVICVIVVLKLSVTLFISLYFWMNWLNFFWSLTLWELAYNIFVLRFRPKKQQFSVAYQRSSSSADCTRELFNGSSGLTSLIDCTQKKNFLVGRCGFFMTDVISKVVLRSFLAHVAWPRATC